jgi:hypothetical protein
MVSAAELERMMKLRDVILKAMAKRISRGVGSGNCRGLGST